MIEKYGICCLPNLYYLEVVDPDDDLESDEEDQIRKAMMRPLVATGDARLGTRKGAQACTVRGTGGFLPWPVDFEYFRAPLIVLTKCRAFSVF